MYFKTRINDIVSLPRVIFTTRIVRVVNWTNSTP